MEEVKDSFDGEGTVYYSYRGILYWLQKNNNCDNLFKAAKVFEKKNKALVYHAILDKLEFGDCLSLLYVSRHPQEWEQDRQDLKDRLPIVYVKNLLDPDCSEFGRIEIKPCMGGLIRIN